MFMRVVAIVLLFRIQLRFPLSKSMSQIISGRYGDTTIKRLRKLEKIDYSLRKAELDLEFLIRCRDNNVKPRFLNFRSANDTLKSSLTYAKCQSNVLLAEVRQKMKNTFYFTLKPLFVLKISKFFALTFWSCSKTA